MLLFLPVNAFIVLCLVTMILAEFKTIYLNPMEPQATSGRLECGSPAGARSDQPYLHIKLRLRVQTTQNERIKE